MFNSESSTRGLKSQVLTNAGASSVEDLERQRCLESLDYVYRHRGKERVAALLKDLDEALRLEGIPIHYATSTPYINTIGPDEQPAFPGDLDIERRIRSLVRWNAMAMVVKANRNVEGLGGHISTYASAATLYEIAFNHFFKGSFGGTRSADQVFFQGHASPGVYARAYLEGRLSVDQLNHFRQELSDTPGLSSYPHPYLMPDFWQFPTVSMGLGPILAIYQARFNRYLAARGFLTTEESRVWCYMGDGEADEPESLGALSIAAREKLDNLTFIVNCNLQKLDGPVRGNGKIIQELEGIFRGAGWNVVKLVWGSEWDAMFDSAERDRLIRRVEEAVDGDFQKYVVEPGSYTRKHFFGKYPELLALVNDKTDQQITKLKRGGHDPEKVYAAYHRAVNHKGQPTVILAKTVKGYGLGEAGEGKNISHQQKKMNEKELREFKTRFRIPISDEEVVETPFYAPAPDSPEAHYIRERREALGGFLPERKFTVPKINVPDRAYFQEFLKGSGTSELSTTMAFVRILNKLLRHEDIGRRIVPIVPDEARTFGMEALFRQVGIYSPHGQNYEPVDRDSLAYYRETVDGQILEEGINEAGSMCSFIAAGTSYATHSQPMIPFYIYYSMFGFQRVGDLMWLCGDIRARGFLLGGTSGRTTLNGEGLQHQDGHSQLMASTIPTLMSYDPSFFFEVALIIQDGLRRMVQENEDVFYYLSVCNENYAMPPMPDGVEAGVLKGIYKFKKGKEGLKLKAHIFGSGTIIREALRAQTLLEGFGVSADVWSATSYKHLRTEAWQVERWNMLHPTETPRKSYIESVLEGEEGPFVAVSDNMRMVSDQIAPWVPGGLFSLGTDGFGRSASRPQLRRFFEVDAESVTVAVLHQLSKKGQVSTQVVHDAIRSLGIDPEKAHGICV